MKIINIAFICLACLLAASCQSNTEKLKKQYIEACADGDFEKARAAVTKLEAENSVDSEKGLKYVNDKEIYALLAKPSRDNDSRIMYLYNAYESYQLPDMMDVLEVAISQGNSHLASKLIKGGVIPTQTTMDAAVSEEDEELVELILSKSPLYILNGTTSKFVNKSLGEEKHRNYLTAVLSEENASDVATQAVEFGYNDIATEIISNNILIVKNNPVLEKFAQMNPEFHTIRANDILKRFSKLRQETPNYHSEGVVEFHEGYDYSNKQPYSDNVKYKMPEENETIRKYNNQLKTLYLEALALGRKDIARQIVNEMRPVIEAYSGDYPGVKIKGYIVDGNHYLIYHNYDEVNRLKSELK